MQTRTRKKEWRPALEAGLCCGLFLCQPFISLVAHDPCVVLGAASHAPGEIQLTLTGEANVAYVIDASSDFLDWTPVVTNSAPTIERNITNSALAGSQFYRARREPLPIFSGALATDQAIDLQNFTLITDSFDSDDPNYSTNGRYDPLKSKDGGDVITNLRQTNAFSAVTAKIEGRLRTLGWGHKYNLVRIARLVAQLG